jgi:hypothetical protein
MTKGVVVRPNLSKEFSARGQVDLINITNSPISGIILTHLRNKHVFNAIIRTFYRTLTLWVARFTMHYN